MENLTKTKIYGDTLLKTPSGLSCYYFETITTDKEGSHYVYSSKAPFYVTMNGVKVEIRGTPPARLYLKPSFENASTKEWCLQPDKEYIINVITETYYLPNDKEGTNTVYEIMDKNYTYEEQKLYRTPRSNWTY